MKRVVLSVLVLTAVVVRTALAHEEGAIHLGAKRVAVGGDLSMRGERLPKNASLRLELRGALETFRLGEVRTDAKGLFQSRVGLPPEVGAGTYKLVAVAPDGDKAAEAELEVTSAPTAAHEMGAHGVANTAPGSTASPHPTAEMMTLPRSTTGLELAVISGFVLLCGGLGGTLVLRAPRPGA